MKKCKGKTVFKAKGGRLVDCEKCGYIHVLPMYTEAELEEFYKHEFSESTPSPNWKDKVQNICKWKKGGTVLDIGCWEGTQLEYFIKKKGWKCTGIELNKKAARKARRKGIEVQEMSVREFFEKFKGRKWDVINVAYVLEHIIDPYSFMVSLKDHLKKGGIAIIEVPNEFNPFQLAYLKKHKVEPYWVSLPTHLNYFNKEGIEKLVKKAGWKVAHGEMSFPMEMFLLMGDDYRKKPVMGKTCYKKLLKMQDTLRTFDEGLVSKFHSSLFSAGIGRSTMLYLKKK
ncbi:MAG: class I SAM-dependent methyltransferase [Candidatus Aadella gelida]|nr:class I SAM-dependent methyltransferase [Candidatus Aadella gelida]